VNGLDEGREISVGREVEDDDDGVVVVDLVDLVSLSSVPIGRALATA
jgi:hypothetical protein